MAVFKILIALSLCLCASSSWAADAPSKSGSGGTPEWVEVQNRLQALKARLATKETQVKGLIRDSQTSRDKQVFEDLKQAHAELRQMGEEYEKLRHQLRYRFPERGMSVERRYQRIEVKSLSEMETQVGMESQLQGNLERIRRQFQSESSNSGGSESSGRLPASQQRAPQEESVTLPAVMAK